MSFSSTGLLQIGDIGFSNPFSMWRYVSDDAHPAVSALGYFAAVGAGGRTLSMGVKIGDIVFAQESTSGATPGRVTLHSVIGSSANASTAGTAYNYDCTVSSAATT